MHYKLNNSVDRWLDRLIDRCFNYIFLDKKRKHEHGSGFCTVFILDTSETMAGEGLHQMKKALWDILDGKSVLLIFCAVKGIKNTGGNKIFVNTLGLMWTCKNLESRHLTGSSHPSGTNRSHGIACLNK